jgi:hypothetical protein
LGKSIIKSENEKVGFFIFGSYGTFFLFYAKNRNLISAGIIIPENGGFSFGKKSHKVEKNKK